MAILRDKFLIFLCIITTAVIIGMFFLRKITHEKIDEALLINQTSKEESRVKGQKLRIVRVIDGDTIELSNGETVRLIGIDAPEVHHPEVPVQRFGEEATQFLKNLAEGQECQLEFEENSVRDAYGRLLAYVYVNGRMLNAELLRRGYAYVYLRFPFKYQDKFIALEKEARSRQYGLWNFTLRDGRITNIIKRYDLLNLKGREEFDRIMDSLVSKYREVSKEEL